MGTRESRKQHTALGIGQLTLIEHALCPLDSRKSHVENLVHPVRYDFTDSLRRRRTATARVFAPLGLSCSDELYLWGLLALTLSMPDASGQLNATPHWLLTQLGLIDSRKRRGGRQYQQFFEAIRRLSLTSYLCDHFYDPTKSEHRRVSFGFLSYSMPEDPNSSRAWSIVWNPVFLSMVGATSGQMRFDMETYRGLDVASRRLFLFASKILYRRATMPSLALRNLCVNVLGMSDTMATRDMKIKASRCLSGLFRIGVFSEYSIDRVSKGKFVVTARRGNYFKQTQSASVASSIQTCPLLQTLIQIGLEPAPARRVLRKYSRGEVQQWTDITQAAMEHHGSGFFKTSPMAYLVDSLKASATGTRTPPDWWHDLRRAELKSEPLTEKSRQVFANLSKQIIGTPNQSDVKNKGEIDRAAEVLFRLADSKT